MYGPAQAATGVDHFASIRVARPRAYNVVNVRLLIERVRIHLLLDAIRAVTASPSAVFARRRSCGYSGGSCSCLISRNLREGLPSHVVAREAAIGEQPPAEFQCFRLFIISDLIVS